MIKLREISTRFNEGVRFMCLKIRLLMDIFTQLDLS